MLPIRPLHKPPMKQRKLPQTQRQPPRKQQQTTTRRATEMRTSPPKRGSLLPHAGFANALVTIVAAGLLLGPMPAMASGGSIFGPLLGGGFKARNVQDQAQTDAQAGMNAGRSKTPQSVCQDSWTQFYEADAIDWAATQPLVNTEFPRTVSGAMTMADANRMAAELQSGQKHSAGASTITVRMANLDAQEIAPHLVVCRFDFAISDSSGAALAFRARVMVDVRGPQVGRSALRDALPPSLTEAGARAHAPEVYRLDANGQKVSWEKVNAERLAEVRRQRLAEAKQRQVVARSNVLMTFFDPRRDCGAHIITCRYIRMTNSNLYYVDSRPHWEQLVSTLAIWVGRQHPTGAEMVEFRSKVLDGMEADAQRCQAFGQQDFVTCMDIVVDANTNTIRNSDDIDG